MENVKHEILAEMEALNLDTSVVKEFDMGELLLGKPSGNTNLGYAQPTVFVPKVKGYQRENWITDMLLCFRFTREPLYIHGPTGCGKTTGVKFFASLLNYPVFEVTGHGRMELSDIVGHHIIDREGKMAFEYGPLPMAMKHGGIFLINELDLLDPGVCAGFNSILDGSPLLIAENGGEVVHPHPMFRFVATANSTGGGDDTGLYQGVVRQNVALMDRFIAIAVDYLDGKRELALLKRECPELDADTQELMVMFANEMRKLFRGESSSENMDAQVEVTVSTRALLRWGRIAVMRGSLKSPSYDPVFMGLMTSVGFKATTATRQTMHELYQRVFNKSVVDAIS